MVRIHRAADCQHSVHLAGQVAGINGMPKACGASSDISPKAEGPRGAEKALNFDPHYDAMPAQGHGLWFGLTILALLVVSGPTRNRANALKPAP